MAIKTITVTATGFTPGSTSVLKSRDSIQFVGSGANYPTSVTISSSTLFGSTSCSVGGSTSNAPNYAVLAGASGTYTVNLPTKMTSLVEEKQAGTIKVDG